MENNPAESDSCELGGGLDDWYDAAIKAGKGFKTEAERQAYIDSLGVYACLTFGRTSNDFSTHR